MCVFIYEKRLWLDFKGHRLTQTAEDHIPLYRDVNKAVQPPSQELYPCRGIQEVIYLDLFMFYRVYINTDLLHQKKHTVCVVLLVCHCVFCV